MSWKLAAGVAAGLLIAIVAGRLLEDPRDGTATWDASRAAGFTSYVLIWLSLTAGMALHLRYRLGPQPRTALLESHRALSVLGLAFVVVHIGGLLLDPVVRFSLLDVLVPFAASYRTVQVAMGAIAGWLVVAVVASTAYAAAMRWSAWRMVHLLSFPAWGLALAHGITTGSDSGSPAAVWVYAGSASVLGAMFVLRVAGRGWVASEG